MFRLPAFLLALAAAFSLASPAAAEWKKATSPNFVVYSDGTEGALRRYVQNLEAYDRVLRFRHNLATDETAARPLPIYLVRGPKQLEEIRYGAPDRIAGFYQPTSEGSFAVAIRDGGRDDFLLHEYAHHFFYGLSPNVPGWLHEGLAEYYMTAEFEGDDVILGNYSPMRAAALLGETWLPLEDLLGKPFSAITRENHRRTYYSVAWVLTHWFMSDPARREQLMAYERLVQEGGDPVRAMEQATGMSLTQLRNILEGYGRRQLAGQRVSGAVRPVEVRIERLGAVADDLLLLNQKMVAGTTEPRERVLAEVRRRAERHGEDRLALFALGHAGLHFGDRPAGLAALQKLLSLYPEDTEAMQFLALGYIEQARDEPDKADDLLGRARGHLQKAYQLDPNDYRTYALIARTQEGLPGFPTDNHLLVRQNAYTLAPGVPANVLAYASALMLKGQFDEAAAVLRPLANHPHRRGANNAAADLLRRAEARQPPPSAAALREAAEAPPEPEQPEPAPPGEPDPADPAKPPAAR